MHSITLHSYRSLLEMLCMYVRNMHVTYTYVYVYTTVTLMLHACTMTVYDLYVAVMVICMPHACNMSVGVTCMVQ